MEKLSSSLPQKDTRLRTQVQAWSQERFWVLLWHRFLRKLEQGICTHGSQYRQVTKWRDHLLHRMPRLLGLQISISNRAVYHQGQVHSNVTGTTWRHSCHEPNTGTREQNFKVICIKPCGYCKVFEDNSGTLELVRLPKLRLRTKHINVCYHAQGTHQDLPYRHQRLDCWCSHKSSGTKWLPTSLPLYVWCVTSLSHQSEGVLHEKEYFGTYLGYLPTIPTSLHCDTSQLIPVSFLGYLGHSTSSSTVELVLFSIVSS